MSDGSCPHGIALNPDLSHRLDRGVPEDIRLRCQDCGAVALADLELALDAIDDVMGYDKGLGEEEWVEWCNTHLPMMKRQGRRKYTLGWS